MDAAPNLTLVLSLLGLPLEPQLPGRSIVLPPFIIEQIRKREEERRQQRPHLELPLPIAPPPSRRSERDDEADRGVLIVDLG